MTDSEKERMRNIDAKSQLGDEVSQADKIWFNENYDEFRNEVYDDYTHWFYHTNKF